MQGLEGGAQRGERVAVDGHADGRGALPVGLPAALGEVAADRTPTKEYRDQDLPFSADSSRKVPGRSAASLR